MDAPGTVVDRLNEVNDWATGSLPLPPLEANDDYMTLAMEVMNNSYYLLRIAASLTSSDLHAEKGVTKRRAIVLGHVVRIAKLYDALRYHTAKKESDICAIFSRLLVETASKVEYLMKAKKESFRSFVLTSYKPEKEMLDDLRRKNTSRALLPIERRMMASTSYR